MFYVVLNVFLYLFLFFTYKGKKKGIDFYKIVVFMYLMTALFCAFNYAQNPSTYPTISLLPFLFMFVVLVILFQPLRGFSINETNLSLSDNRAYMVFASIYIILAIIDTVTSISGTVERFQSGDWSMLRNALYEDTENIELYANQWQRLIKNFLSYTSPFAFVYAFYCLTRPDKRRFYILLLFASITVPAFISATVVASRGMVFGIAIELFIGYWMFKRFIPKKRKRLLFIGAVVLALFFLFYSITVSISRFGEEEASHSVFVYFGHSMLAFNDQMFYNMHDFAWGKRFFSWFIDALGGNSAFDTAKAGSTHGTAFITIVGGMFVDWGYILTIPVAFVACLLVGLFTHRKVLRFSDLIVVFFYINTLCMGVFAFGKGRALNWLMILVMYFIVRSTERKRTPVSVRER